MKKSKVAFGKKLFMVKETIARLEKQQQTAVAGGATAACGPSNGDPTYDPQRGCITNPCPGRICS